MGESFILKRIFTITFIKLYEWWLELAYLGYRDSVCVWSSPGFVFPHRTFQSTDEQLDFTAKMIRGVLDFKTLLDE